MISSLTTVDNCQAWGIIVGRNPEFPDLVLTDRTTPRQIWPGMLVSSYDGQKHLDATGKLGLGMVIAVRPHPCPRGDVRFLCVVLWNFDKPGNLTPLE